ncbi:uncharacterized protein GGS22DRAFT_188287 [Annulohypoxylon maeteangense]|uniref:uncharacterized protein n=1 Tax=Annulohypoxylon maeteangense TaxID=1927788 RepID=UPI00200871F3|nr:uncharacterized protein GGS22DRAFT_188287 [Annulohypoxylon maeteangense]KAI0885008.1 hypothetical protein GGS22DRAFT_188287 [Annulohypoxylon maeteangense]
MAPDDILYYLAKNGIREPRVIARLSQTCRHVSKLLDPLLYRADVMETKQKLAESASEFPFPYSRNEEDSFLNWAPVDGQQWLMYPLMTVKKIPALHWAIDHKDKELGLTVTRKSIKSALKYWPSYLQVCCGGVGQYMDGMAPLHLAAISGNEEIFQEVMKASSIVDMRVYLESNFRKHIGDSTLSETAWSFVEQRSDISHSHMVVNPLGLAILYGHIHIAETLARVTQDLVEEICESDADLMSPLKMAVLHKMLSVVKILESRGYRSGLGDIYFCNNEISRIAAANDGNEEMLRHLLRNREGDHEQDSFDAFELALELHCKSNLLFIAEHRPPIDKPFVFLLYIKRLIQTDDFLPVVKALLGAEPILCRHISKKIETYLYDHRGEGIWAGRGVMIQDYLLNHPDILYSGVILTFLLEDQKVRKEYRQSIKTLPKHQQEFVARLDQEICGKNKSRDWRHTYLDVGDSTLLEY